MIRYLLLIGVSILVKACFGDPQEVSTVPSTGAAAEEDSVMAIQISSGAFAQGEAIPVQYTCDGEDISPPLAWSGIPDGTRSIALINDDPDAPGRVWVHWVIYNIPADSGGLPENVPTDETLDSGAIQGSNDFRRVGYGGPCPPRGTSHRYFFKLYALDSDLSLDPGATKADVLSTMEGHILGEGQLMGTYQRQ
jgi:hypothetical protein